jgi:hypothetical protein
MSRSVLINEGDAFSSAPGVLRQQPRRPTRPIRSSTSASLPHP